MIARATNALLDEALRLAALGWRVFPLQPNKKTPWQGTHGVKDASTDSSVIEAWWTQVPDANIGLATGGGVIALDVDPAAAETYGAEWVAQLEYDSMGTPKQSTPRGGFHLFYRLPTGVAARNSAGKIGYGIDLRADGGYVVVAPSHGVDQSKGIDGAYKWIEPIECAPGELPEAPSMIIQAIKDTEKPCEAPPRAGGDATGGPIPEGKRNCTLTSIAGSMRMCGHSGAGIAAALHVANRERCVPPLSDSEVEKIAASVSRYEPDERAQRATEAGEANGPDAEPAGSPNFVCMADVPPEEVRWLWPNRIPLGKLTIIAGDPGLGKSYMVLDIIARVSKGFPWPDAPGSDAPLGGAVILTCEDGLGDTIRPRLDTLGADCAKIVAMRGVNRGDGKMDQLTLDDIAPLRRMIESVDDCKAVMIDALSGYLGSADSHKNAETRAVLANLALLAEETGAAIIGVSHLSKSGVHIKRSAYRVMGSLAFVAAPRAVWAVGVDPDDEDRRIIANIKMNIAKPAPSWAYRIDDIGLHWETTACGIYCDTALGDERGGDRDSPALDQACEFLEAQLCVEPRGVAVKDLKRRAADADHSWRTIERAKKRIGIEVERRGGAGADGAWWWFIPGAAR